MKEYIAAVVFGILLGFIVQRSRYCMTGAIRDYILFGVTRNLKITLMVLAIITFFYTLFLTYGIFNPTLVPAGWFTFVGGVIFGIGMALGGGCVTSTFYRIGEGQWNYLVSAIFMLVGIIAGSALFNIAPYAFFYEGYTFMGYDYGLVWLNDLLGVSPIVVGVVQAAIFALAYYKIARSEA
ncbi:MAG: YeeE/YedE family protein [Euryarchaeota archaeon]|nr:YeeE/YedE family protein [Euryarchaeota archaeon]